MADTLVDYQRVEQILFKGYLEANLYLDWLKAVWSLRSLNHLDFDLIYQYALRDTHPLSIQRWTVLFATTMIDHNSYLTASRKNPRELIHFICALSAPQLLTLYRVCLGLQRAVTREQVKVEAFTYGAMSNRYWAAYRHLPLNSPAVTGREGTELLGLNYGQIFWSFVHAHKEKRDQDETAWENALLSIAAQSPKDYRQSVSQVRRRQEERSRAERALYEGRPYDAVIPEGQTETMVIAQTAEQLLEQMERAVRGEKDQHDLAVERFVRQRQLQRKSALDELRQKAAQAKAWREENFMDDRSVVPLTPAQLQEYERRTQRTYRETLREAHHNAQLMGIDPDSETRYKG